MQWETPYPDHELVPFTKFSELKRLVAELGYKKTKKWYFVKDVSDILWVELDFNIRGWKRIAWPHLAASIGDRRVSRILAVTGGIPFDDADHYSSAAHILPIRKDIGRELFGPDWKSTTEVGGFDDLTYPEMERQIRIVDKYMVSNASDAFFDYLMKASTSNSGKMCYLLARERFEEAAEYYKQNKDFIDTGRPGIRVWLIQHKIISPSD